MTTTEVATIDDNEFISSALTTVDPFDTLNRYSDMLAKALKFAQDVCRTSLVPKIYQNKPGDAAVAILHGTELGLHPLQALQNIFSVHGMPAIYAKTMVALLKVKGYRFQTHETGPDKVVFQAWSPNGKQTETATWTIERAIKAGFVPTIDPETGKLKTKKLTGANGPYEKLIGNEKYLTQPEEMLWAKAASTVCRRLAPHVLLGLSFVEDMEDEDEPEPVRVQSERVTPVAVGAGGPANTGLGLPVQQWQRPAEDEAPAEPASQDGAEPDTVQVDEPPAKPAKASTKTQQTKIARLLDERGLVDGPAKLAALGTFFDRAFASAAELTWDEAIRLLAHLEDDPVATAEQVARLGALLDECGLSEDGAAEERAAFLEAKTGRVIGALAHLTGREVEAIEALIDGTPATDETTGGAQ